MIAKLTIPEGVEPEVVIAYQELTINALRQEIADLESQNRLIQQVSEAMSDKNRYYASLVLGRPANDNEAFLHYVFCGGKLHFDEVHPATAEVA